MTEILGYRLHKELRFEVCGEEFTVTQLYAGDQSTLFVEEVRKNRQEDTHMAGELQLRNGKWEWEDDWARKQFARYGNEGVEVAIPAYLDAHPIPDGVL